MDLKIGHINAQRSRAAAANLELIMGEHGLDVLCIQEPFTYKGKVRGYTSPGFRVIQPSVDNPWVAAVINSGRVEVFQNANLESGHVICFQAITEIGQINIINMYCQYSLDIEPFITRLEELLGGLKGQNVVITMDANAKSDWWFSGMTDERGEKLEEMILEQGLRVVNKPNNPPTFSSQSGESNIDITLASEKVARCITDWRVDTICTTSDHNLVVLEISLGSSVGMKTWTTLEGYNIRRANWGIFKTMTNNDFNEQTLDAIGSYEVDEAVREFNKILANICDKSIPRRRGSNKTVPWWNRDLTVLRMTANRAKKQLVRARKLGLVDVTDCADAYRKARNKYTAKIKVVKMDAWKNFVNKVGNEDPWSIVYKIVRDKVKKPNALCSLMLSTGRWTANWLETASAILDKVLPREEKEKENESHKAIRMQNSCYVNCNLEPEISINEIDLAVKKLRNNKAPGSDGFKSEIIKALWKEDKKTMQALLNKCLRNSVFPEEWKKTTVRVILKNSNKDRSQIGSYRPIALIPTMGKVYERIIMTRIMMNYKESKLDSTHQFGFKPGLSTEDAFLRFRDGVVSDRRYVAALFVDIEGAFDNLWWEAIISRLLRAGCSSCLVDVVRSYLQKREMTISSQFNKISRYMERGCPQGSIIGPIAWNLCMDVLLEALNNEFPADVAEAIAYADDLVIIIKGNSRVELERIGGRAVEMLDDWCITHKLKISVSKTAALLMKGKFDRERMPIIKHQGKNIKFVREVKYLGVVVDDRLSFVSHAKYLRDKMTKFVMSIMRIARQEWGLKRRILSTLYGAVAIPIATYGAIMWYDKTQNAHVKRNLLAMQRSLLLVVTRACRTTSTSAMQIVSGQMPLDLRIIQRGIISRVKRNRNTSWGRYVYNCNDIEEDTHMEEETNKIMDEAERKWQETWTQEEHGRQTHSFIPDVVFAQKNRWFNPGRWCTYAITGYGPINSTLFKRGAVEDSKCTFCDEEETVEHMIYGCPGYEEERRGNIQLCMEERRGLNQLIGSKEAFESFSLYVNKMFEKRKTYLETLDSRIGSASSWHGTGNAGAVGDDGPGG